MARGVKGIWPWGDSSPEPTMRTTAARDLLDAHFESVEHARRDALLLAQQAEQQVLGADVVVLQGPRLFLREDDDLTGAFGEAFEHRAVSLPVARPCEEWRGRGAVALPSPPGPSAPRKAT